MSKARIIQKSIIIRLQFKETALFIRTIFKVIAELLQSIPKVTFCICSILFMLIQSVAKGKIVSGITTGYKYLLV